MGMRLALVAIRMSFEGPWTLAKGNEEAVKITGLGVGEHVMLDYMVGEISDSVTYIQPGVHPLPFKRAEKYRLRKIVNGKVNPQSTTVEIVLNESSQR